MNHVPIRPCAGRSPVAHKSLPAEQSHCALLFPTSQSPPCPLHSSPIAGTKRTTTISNHSGLRIPTMPSGLNIYEQTTGNTANTDRPVVSRSAQERPGSLTSTFTRSPPSPSLAPMTPATTHTTIPPRIYPDSTLEFRLSVTATLEVRHPSSQPLDTAQLLLLRGKGFHISATLSHGTPNGYVSYEYLGQLLERAPVTIPIPRLLSTPLTRTPDVAAAGLDPRAFHPHPHPASVVGNPPSALVRERKLCRGTPPDHTPARFHPSAVRQLLFLWRRTAGRRHCKQSGRSGTQRPLGKGPGEGRSRPRDPRAGEAMGRKDGGCGCTCRYICGLPVG
jgi:hypothetical protein